VPYNWWVVQKNVVYIYMEFYSALRNNDNWFEDKWRQLKDIMITEVSQAQKDKDSIFLSYVEDRPQR
jgi:hypothetical protein